MGFSIVRCHIKWDRFCIYRLEVLVHSVFQFKRPWVIYLHLGPISTLDLFNHHKHVKIGKSLSIQIDDQMLNPDKSSDHQQEKEETKIDEISVDNDHQMDIEM